MLLTVGSAVSVQYVETEQLENIMVLPVVMGAKDSLDAVYGKIMFIHAGSAGNVLLTRTKGISADIVV